MKKSICCIIKNEQRFLKEWLEYHLNLGFDAIYCYEDYRSDTHKDITDEYENVFLSTCEEYGVPNYVSPETQDHLYKKFLNEHNDEYDWIAFIDVDEFIILDNEYTLDKLFEEYKDYAGIWLSWKMYNANGHIKRPEGKVMDNYTQVVEDNDDNMLDSIKWNKKSVVNCHVAVDFLNIHLIKGGVDINYNGNKLAPKVFKKAWINHYFSKSWEDYLDRIFNRGNLNNHLRCLDQFFDQNPDMADKKIELCEKERYRHTAVNMYVSRDLKIISGGNVNIIKKLKGI